MNDLFSTIFENGVVIATILLFILSTIVGYYFWYQSLKKLAAKTGVDYFRIAGLLYFIGAITSIILIGGLVIFVAWIFHIVAYFNLRPENFEIQPEQAQEANKQINNESKE